MDLPAELIVLMYRYRWQIELFFRWFKCVLGCKHLLAHSENGLTIQVYCALIASLLIRLWTGRKPTKRTFEMICLYFQGWATLEELIEHIEKLNSKEQKQQYRYREPYSLLPLKEEVRLHFSRVFPAPTHHSFSLLLLKRTTLLFIPPDHPLKHRAEQYWVWPVFSSGFPATCIFCSRMASAFREA